MRRISSQDLGKIVRAQIARPPKGELPLHAFMRLFWRTVEPREFIDGRHLHAEAEAFTAVIQGDIKQLVVNIPPNSCKSLFLNVFLPAFIWLEVDPLYAFAFASYDSQLVNRDAEKFMNLLTSDLCKHAYPEFSIKPNQGIENLYNNSKGYRFGTTPGKGFTGRHFNLHVYDDLVKPANIKTNVPGEFQAELQRAISWLEGTASNRALDPEELRRILSGQRLHDLDPSGYMLAQGDWEHLCLPARFVSNAKWIKGDLTKRLEWREEEGQLLWPERRGVKAEDLADRRLGSPANVSAQQQQNATPAKGGIISTEDCKYFDEIPSLKGKLTAVSLDLSFGGEKAENSRVAWQFWAAEPLTGTYYCLNAGAKHLSFSESKKKVRELMQDSFWGQARVWLIENKANGPALISDLQSLPHVLIPVEPGAKNKAERMLPHVELFEGGKVYFSRHLKDVVEEISKFPRAAYDDHFDTASQALTYFEGVACKLQAAAAAWTS